MSQKRNKLIKRFVRYSQGDDRDYKREWKNYKLASRIRKQKEAARMKELLEYGED